jgi:murein tripeptide amidase MpaA
MQGEAFQDWRVFEHPQLGQVEIGGWKTKLYEQNVPLKYLKETCEQHSRFTLVHASLNPRLTLHHFNIDALGDDLFRLTLVIENAGFLPTYTSQKALERKVVRPIEAELSLPEGVSVVSGKQKQELGQLEGRSNKIKMSFSFPTPTDNRSKVEWVLKGVASSTIQLTVRSQRAGTLRHTFVLAANQTK